MHTHTNQIVSGNQAYLQYLKLRIDGQECQQTRVSDALYWK